MLIDEAIAHAREEAKTFKEAIVPECDYQNMEWIDDSNEHCKRQVEYYEQLAEWLEELKELRTTKTGYTKEDIELNRDAMYNKGRADAIDEMQEKLCGEMEKHSTSARPVGWSKEIDILTLDNVVDIIFEVAEQLKEEK